MILLNLKKRPVNKTYSKYKIDWKADSASKSQFFVKQFLFKYWSQDMVFEEFPILGTRLRMDFYNATRKINIEYDGSQHVAFNKFFHGTKAGFLSSIKRDFNKVEFCEINNITQIVLEEEDLKNLSYEYIYQKFNVKL